IPFFVQEYPNARKKRSSAAIAARGELQRKHCPSSRVVRRSLFAREADECLAVAKCQRSRGIQIISIDGRITRQCQSCRSLLSEISRMIDIGNQARLFRLPVELRAGARARGRSVDACEHREPTKMLGRLCGRLRDNRNVEAATNHLGDLLERHALLGYGMEVASFRTA